MDQRHPCQGRHGRRVGFTLIELLVTISVILLLMMGATLAVSQVRDTAKRTKCMSSLRQWHLALAAYANENRSKLPDVVWNSPQYIWVDGIPAGSWDVSIGTLFQDPDAVRVTNGSPVTASTQVTFSSGLRCPSWRSVWGNVSVSKIGGSATLYCALIPGYQYYNRIYNPSTTATWSQADLDAYSTGRLDSTRLLISDTVYYFGTSPSGLLRRYHDKGQNQAFGDGRVTWRLFSKAENEAIVLGTDGCPSVSTGATRYYR